MTQEQLSQITKNLDFNEVNELFEKYEINTPQRQAMFFAQCGHESGDFKVKKENFNYRADRLIAVFPKYFNNNNVTDYLGDPKKIASRVYANRMGNGDEASCEGYQFCGRGFIQLTGKNNYQSFATKENIPLDDVCSYLETNKGALHSALFFWDREDINKYADNGDVTGATKRINGGTHGLQDRQARYDKYLKILS